jgi:hypothetical protein
MSLSLFITHSFVKERAVNKKHYNNKKNDVAWLNIKLFKVKIYHNINISLNQSDIRLIRVYIKKS